MLDEKWFAARGFYPVPPDEIDGRILYAHRKGAFMNKFGLLLKHGFCLAKRQRNNRRSGKVYPYMVNYRAYCHRLIGRTFLRKLREGEVYDHINGDISNYSLHNLRIVKKAINDRDGGFLRMLRNRGIDPTMYDQSFLLRFFKRMARKKKKLKPWKYQSLTHTDLLKMLVSPEYRVGSPLDPAAEPTKYYDPFCERDDPDPAAHLAPFYSVLNNLTVLKDPTDLTKDSSLYYAGCYPALKI